MSDIALVAANLGCAPRSEEEQILDLMGKVPVVTNRSLVWIPESEHLEYTSALAQKVVDLTDQNTALNLERNDLLAQVADLSRRIGS